MYQEVRASNCKTYIGTILIWRCKSVSTTYSHGISSSCVIISKVKTSIQRVVIYTTIQLHRPRAVTQRTPCENP
jgi:hypothetical protein